MKKYIVNYYGPGHKGDSNYWKPRQERLNRTALETGGFDEAIAWNRDKLVKTDFSFISDKYS